MTSPPGERRRRRELERARELAEQEASGDGATPDGTGVPATPDGVRAAVGAPSPVGEPPGAAVPGAGRPREAPAAGVPQPRSGGDRSGADPGVPRQPPAGVPRQPSPLGAAAGLAAAAGGERPLSRRELRERERRRAEEGVDASVDPDAPASAGEQRHTAADGIPAQRSGSPGSPGSPGWPVAPAPAGLAAPADGPASVRGAPDADHVTGDADHRADHVTGDADHRPGDVTGDAGHDADGGPHPEHDEHDPDFAPHQPHRYTPKHLLVLAAVAFVLGFLVWSLIAGANGAGAVGAVPADPTPPPSTATATPRGEP